MQYLKYGFLFFQAACAAGHKSYILLSKARYFQAACAAGHSFRQTAAMASNFQAACAAGHQTMAY